MNTLRDIREVGAYTLIVDGEQTSRTFRNENTAVCYLWAFALRKNPQTVRMVTEDGAEMTNRRCEAIEDAPDGMRAAIQRLVNRMNREDKEHQEWEQVQEWADTHSKDLAKVVQSMGVEHLPNVLVVVEREIRKHLGSKPEKVWQEYNDEMLRMRVYR